MTLSAFSRPEWRSAGISMTARGALHRRRICWGGADHAPRREAGAGPVHQAGSAAVARALRPVMAAVRRGVSMIDGLPPSFCAQSAKFREHPRVSRTVVVRSRMRRASSLIRVAIVKFRKPRIITIQEPTRERLPDTDNCQQSIRSALRGAPLTLRKHPGANHKGRVHDFDRFESTGTPADCF